MNTVSTRRAILVGAASLPVLGAAADFWQQLRADIQQIA